MSRFVKCPICGISLKKKNLKQHIVNIHTTTSKRVKTPTDRCQICSRPHDPPLDTHQYVCGQHILKDSRSVLIPQIYLKLVSKTNEIMKNKSEIIPPMVFQQLPSIIHGMSLVSDTSTLDMLAFYGYVLLRVKSVFPDIEKQHPLITKPPKYDADLGITLIDELKLEFRLIESTILMGLGLYHIIDELRNHKRRMYIVSNLNSESIRTILNLYTQDYEKEWRINQNVVWPTDLISIDDPNGRWFHIESKEIQEDFETFAKCWEQSFGLHPTFDANGWDRLRSFVDFVISPEGMSDFSSQCGNDSKDVEKILDQICPTLDSHNELISTRIMSNSSCFPSWYHKLASIGSGFKIQCNNETIYHLPVRHWLKLKTNPVLLKFAIAKNLVGQSFEEELSQWIAFYDKVGIMLVKSQLPIGPIAKSPDTDQKKDFSIDATFVEKNYPIHLTDDEISKQIGREGEIDLIIYCNHSLYLIEAKSVNMDDRHAQRYLREKAGKQCARFAHWVKHSSDFLDFLGEHNIVNADLRSVRILVGTCGGTPQLTVSCSTTDEKFAVLPRSFLFNMFTGVLTMNLASMDRQFHEIVAQSLNTIESDVKEVVQIFSPENRFIAMLLELYPWLNLSITDRRENEVQESESWRMGSLQKYMGYFSWFEPMIGNTGKWIFDQPLLLGHVDKYEVYTATQISEAGKTVFCDSCDSIIRYFHSNIVHEQEQVNNALSKQVCPMCGNQVINIEATLLFKSQNIFLQVKESLVESRFPDRLYPKP